jgi:hypothetical protein
MFRSIICCGVALYLNRRLLPFTAPNSQTGGLSTFLKRIADSPEAERPTRTLLTDADTKQQGSYTKIRKFFGFPREIASMLRNLD